MYNEEGETTWQRSLDSNGAVKHGDNSACPFLYQGQYYDVEIELAYNRFRYYSPDSGTYISQDPIGLAGNNPNFYAYVDDLNGWVDVFGLTTTVPGTSGIYTLTNPTLGEAYVGSAVDGNARLSNSKHEKAQRLLNHKDTKIEFREVDLGTADSRRDKGNILRHYEQKDLEAIKRKKKFTILNSNNPEAKKKNKRNRVLVEEHGASRKKKQTYQKK